MITRAELKQRARAQLKGNYGILFLITLIVTAITSAVSVTFIGGLIVAGPLSLAMVFYYRGMAYGDKPEINRIFDGFSKCFVNSMFNMLLQSLYLMLWALLIIPAYVKIYSYAMSMYIQADNLDMSANECITRSRQMMVGHKFSLFVLDLSFIPWILLCAITFGIAAIWVVPYIEQTRYNFYLAIKEG